MAVNNGFLSEDSVPDYHNTVDLNGNTVIVTPQNMRPSGVVDQSKCWCCGSERGLHICI